MKEGGSGEKRGQKYETMEEEQRCGTVEVIREMERWGNESRNVGQKKGSRDKRRVHRGSFNSNWEQCLTDLVLCLVSCSSPSCCADRQSSCDQH